jgi:formamidopyrimidine-DNA glycosylase
LVPNSRRRSSRPLYTALRDQHVIAGIGRSWVDEILWSASLSPFKRGAELDADEVETLTDAIRTTLGSAIEHYERTLALPLPDKLPMPLLVHRHARAARQRSSRSTSRTMR